MKKIIILFNLLLLGFTVNAQVSYNAGTNTYTISGNNFGSGIVFNGATSSPPISGAAKIIVMPNIPADYISFENINTGQVVKITNSATGQVVMQRANDGGIGIFNCRNILLAGDFDGTLLPPTNPTDTVVYGFKVDNRAMFFPGFNAAKPSGTPTYARQRGLITITGTSGNIEIRQVGGYNLSFSGIWMNNSSANYGYFRLFDSKIDNTAYEGLYIGSTDGGATSTLDSARVERCIISRTWNNAVQIVRGVNNAPVTLRNNTFRDIAVNQSVSGQHLGLAFSGSENVLIERNVFENVNGEWLQRFGPGKTIVRNNVVRSNKGIFWNNALATDSLIVQNNTIIMSAATAYLGYNNPPFASQTGVFVNQATAGAARVKYQNNILVNTTPSPTEINASGLGGATVSNNYYATALAVANGFVSTTSPLVLTNLRSVGYPSFTPDVRLVGATNAGRGANTLLLNWPAIGDPPPSQPGFPSFTNTTTSGTTVNWAPSTSATSTIVRYRVFLNGVKQNDSTASTTRVLTGLAPATSYSFSLRAVDALGQESPQNANSFTTLAAPDVQAPTVPGAATFSNITTNSVTISTTGSTDNVAVTKYIFRVNGVALADSTNSLTRDMTGLLPGTVYNVTVQAVDAAGNRSVTASTTSFTTLSPPSATVSISRPRNGKVVVITTGTSTIAVRPESLVVIMDGNNFTFYFPSGVNSVTVPFSQILPTFATPQALFEFIYLSILN